MTAGSATEQQGGGQSPRATRRLLQATSLVSTLDRFGMAPMLVAIAVDLGAPLGQVVTAAGVYFLTYGLMQPVWGLLTDRLGLVRVMRLTLALGAVASATSALAWSVLSLAVIRGLAGAFFAAAVPSTLVYVGDTVPAQHRQRDVTDLMAGVAVGTGIAAVCAGIIADQLSWRLWFVVTSVTAAALAVALRRLDEPPAQRDRSSLLAPLSAVLRHRWARLVLLLGMAEGVVLLGLLTLLPTSLEHGGASASVAGGVTAGFAIAVLAGAQATGRLSRRVPAARILGFGAAVALVACLTAAASSAVAAGVAVALLLGIAWSAMHSTMQTWATQVYPAQRAASVSLFAGALFAGSALGTLLLGGLAEKGRFGAAFLALAAVTVPLGLVGSVGRARWGRRPHKPVGEPAQRTSVRTSTVSRLTAVRPPTLRDVALGAGVHPATASRALNPQTRSLVNEETASRVIRIAEELGYRPNPIARSLKTARSGTVGLVIPDLTNPLFPPIVRGIEDVLGPAGYSVWIVNTDNDPERERSQIDSLRSRHVEGLIVATARLEHGLLDELHEQGMPMVLINRRLRNQDVPSVTPDDASGAVMAVAHLVSLGHRRIAHLAGPQDTSTGLVRTQGYREALKAHGIEDDPRLVATCSYWTEAEGARALSGLLDSGADFTAVLAGNDLLALGCYDVLEERGLRCPDNLSVVGFNDMPFIDKLRPPLTSVRVPHYKVGAEAARMLTELLQDPTRHQRSVLLPLTLKVRQSTSAVGAH